MALLASVPVGPPLSELNTKSVLSQSDAAFIAAVMLPRTSSKHTVIAWYVWRVLQFLSEHG